MISSEFAGLPGSGGIGSYFDHLARGLVRAGCELEVFTSGNPGDLPERDGVRFHHLGADLNALEFVVDAGRAFQKRHQEAPFDVLECGELKVEGSVAHKLVPDVALVVRMHSPSVILDRYLDFDPGLVAWWKRIFFHLTGAIGAWRKGLPLRPVLLEPFGFAWIPPRDAEERNFAASADLVVVMSEDMRRFVEGHWWIKPDAIRKVPNPLLLERKPISVCAKPSGGERKIGFLGRIEARKGIVEVSKALHGLLPLSPDWVLEVAGRNTKSCISGRDYRKEMERILGPALNQVRFLENLPPDAVAAWLEGVDIFVFPSLWDNFPYVILEAMACGKAIVATRTGAVPEMIGETGLLVPPGDVKALAGALRKLMGDEELRSRLGEAARKRFEERFHPDRVMGEILEVYREAALRAEDRR